MTQAEGLYQALFQHAGDAIVLIDAALMAIVAANPAAERMSGYTQAELYASRRRSLIMPVLAGSLQQYDGALRVRGGQSMPVSIGVSEVVFDGTPLSAADCARLSASSAGSPRAASSPAWVA